MDVDLDQSVEIVAAGYGLSGLYQCGCVKAWNFDGVSFADKFMAVWLDGYGTTATGVALGNIDSAGKNEIVTAGYYDQGGGIPGGDLSGWFLASP
jgi:hypothetical protein